MLLILWDRQSWLRAEESVSLPKSQCWQKLQLESGLLLYLFPVVRGKWVEVVELTVGQKMSQISQVMSGLKTSCSNEWLKIPVQFRHPWLCSPGMVRRDSLLCWRFIEVRAGWRKGKGYHWKVKGYHFSCELKPHI